MSGFSAEWLSLREPYDAAARNPMVLKAVGDAFARKQALRIVDLGCGTGSTLRTLARRLRPPQDWKLVDHDSALLERALQNAAALHVPAAAVRADLNREIASLLSEPADLVTMSALLDLVSDAWLERFVNASVARGVHVYAALSYDGRVELAPAHPLDEAVVNAVNRHQRGDKGFGLALGPSAATAAVEKFVQRGYSVHRGTADWIASGQDKDFQNEIVRGWAAAARETGTVSAEDVERWRAFRQSEIAGGRSSLRVGHVDFLAVPPSAA